jgi:hypothetical protein
MRGIRNAGSTRSGYSATESQEIGELGLDVRREEEHTDIGMASMDLGRDLQTLADTPALGDVLVAFDSVWFSGYTKDTVWRITA